MTSIDDVIRLLEAAKASGGDPAATAPKKAKKASRGPTAYNKRYAREFKRLAPKYKTKKGSWRKGGFKACQKAAHRACKK